MRNQNADAELYKYRRVLDHGYVALVDYMGSDESIVEAARVSYGKGTRATSDDETLIRYLAGHRHTTPTEMVVLKFNIAMPIHVHRQHIRHRMSTTNEYSARYSIVPEVTYDSYEFNAQSKNNKQGRTDSTVEKDYRELIDKIQTGSFNLYNQMVDAGVAKEIARMHLPLNTYTYYYWKIDLHNLFHYLGLRCDAHAQREIREYANCMAGIVKQCYPIAFKAWYDYQFAGSHLSRMDRILLDFAVRNDPTREQIEIHGTKILGMTKREVGEFFNKISPPEEKDFNLDQFPIIEAKA